MAKMSVSIALDDEEKRAFQEICEGSCMGMANVLGLFAKSVVRKGRIPFEFFAEPDAGQPRKGGRHA